MVYGIGHGSRYYFDKPASALTHGNAPSWPPCSPAAKVYNPYRHLERVSEALRRAAAALRQKGVLSEVEYRQSPGRDGPISAVCRGRWTRASQARRRDSSATCSVVSGENMNSDLKDNIPEVAVRCPGGTGSADRTAAFSCSSVCPGGRLRRHRDEPDLRPA